MQPRKRTGWIEKRSIEGSGARAPRPTFYSALFLRNERRQPMSADDLKRKIRNFPAANLNQRIAATV
jgi:hypothetical protein